MEQNDKELINYAKETLRKTLEDELKEIEFTIKGLKAHPADSDYKHCLEMRKMNYMTQSTNYKEIYGVEFPEIEKKYNELTPKINEVLK